MLIDISSLLTALTVNLVTMALALPAVMGPVGPAARRAQIGVFAHAAGWAFLLASGGVAPGSWADLLLSTASMACLAGSMALLAAAFDRWYGRDRHARIPVLIAVVLPLGYAIGFGSYPFRVGWANGLLVLQMSMVAAALVRKPVEPVGAWRWLLVVSLAVQMITTGWRGVIGAFFTASYPSFLTPHPVNTAFALLANATTVLTVIGILLAHRDEAARALERLATLDGLTGVFNRRAWLAQAAVEMAVSQRYEQPLVVLMIDLDHFKHINDTRGHEAGDHALQYVAAALHASVRAGDLVGRYGGEEFCVLMNHADAAAANAFDRRLRARLAKAGDALGFEIGYSAGIASRAAAGAGGDDTLEAMLRRADAMLYRAKGQGRARTLDEAGAQLELL